MNLSTLLAVLIATNFIFSVNVFNPLVEENVIDTSH